MKNSSLSPVASTAAIAALFLALVTTSFSQTATPTTPRRARGAKAAVSESVRAGTVIAPDGQIAVTSIDRKWDPKSGTGTLNEAAVTPDGRMYTREANLTLNPDQTITAKGTLTDFDGDSFNYTETSRQTAAGPVVQGKMIGVDGRTATYETTTAKTADQQTKRTTVITHQDGTKETRVEVLAAARTVAGI
jgi:hypothetical protein